MVVWKSQISVYVKVLYQEAGEVGQGDALRDRLFLDTRKKSRLEMLRANEWPVAQGHPQQLSKFKVGLCYTKSSPNQPRAIKKDGKGGFIHIVKPVLREREIGLNHRSNKDK